MSAEQRSDKRDRLVSFIRSELSPTFETDTELLAVLDSVGFLRIVMFIESDFGVTLDISHMGAENFRNVETLLDTIEGA